MKQVIIDTNVLMLIGELDIFDEIAKAMHEPFEFSVLDATMAELEKLKTTGTGKEKRTAKLAHLMLLQKKVHVITTGEQYADDALVDLSTEAIIATSDKELKKRLQGKILVPRQKKYFVLQ